MRKGFYMMVDKVQLNDEYRFKAGRHWISEWCISYQTNFPNEANLINHVQHSLSFNVHVQVQSFVISIAESSSLSLFPCFLSLAIEAMRSWGAPFRFWGGEEKTGRSSTASTSLMYSASDYNDNVDCSVMLGRSFQQSM
jgi:hypothetical protein